MQLLFICLLLLIVVVGSLSNRYKWKFCEADVISHLFEPPWINDQGKEVQTTFCDHFSRSSAWSQGGKQFFPRGPTHPGRRVFKGFGSEALCKASVWRLKEEGVVTPIYCSDQYVTLLEPKSSSSGKVWSKMDRGKWKSRAAPRNSLIA